MALVQYGSIVTNMKGKLGGHYFTNGLSGSCVSTTPRQPKNVATKAYATSGGATSSKAVVSYTLLYVIRSWKNVSAANKLAWQAAAPNFPTVNKLGVPTKPSAYHCYIHINYRYFIIHGSLLSSPPAVQIGVVPQQITINTLSSSSVIINFSPAVPTGYLCYLRATASISPGVKPAVGQWVTIDYLSSSSTGNINVTSQYAARFGNPITGNTVWFEVVLSSLVTGLLGQPYIIGQVVT